MKILSCVPKQRFTFQSKVDWVVAQAKKHKPDLFVLPQEYHGGVQKQFFDTVDPLVFSEDQILTTYVDLAKAHGMGISVGALIHDAALSQTRERIYVIDADKGVTGQFDKMMLPAYDHIDAKGTTMVTPENEFETREKVAYVQDVKIGILFCWEVYSNYIWHSLCRAKPDIVLSQIKFGICGWPQKGHDENGQAIVKGFGFGNDGGWLNRLKFASSYDIAGPIVCSTNSWDLPKRSRPLCGTIFPFNYAEDTLWHPAKGERGIIEEKVVLDDFNPIQYRLYRENKMRYFAELNDWPPGEPRSQTMMWKIRRMERKAAGIKDESWSPPKKHAEGQETLFKP